MNKAFSAKATRCKCISKAKKNQQQMQLGGSDWIKTVCVQLQEQGDLQVESNCAYDTFARQIPTVDNVAYGQIQSDSNFLSDHACSDYETKFSIILFRKEISVSCTN